MRRTHTLLIAGLAGCAALAACNGTSQQPTPEATEAVSANEGAPLQSAGWDRLFTSPADALAAASDDGFAPESYDPTGGEPPYQAKSAPITLSGSTPDAANQASFTASGNQADKIGTITFSLQLGDSGTAKQAEQHFADMIRQYLSSFGIEDDKNLLAAITNEQNTDGTIAGTPVTIDTGVQTGAMPEVINVTFTRPDATSPDNSKPQG
ncbi:hypothetical protein [Stakelama marina]|uniref:Lipoprotein n=1 Tax=Stakelama marina TaxID=2826939 RepID=A0A8T4IMM4_9SPHN|nr:hypothetical protein [Stakelama marina]MBR0553406.1 hypothetical protein [Stakelama marina]